MLKEDSAALRKLMESVETNAAVSCVLCAVCSVCVSYVLRLEEIVVGNEWEWAR